ncbi:MAG TPA: T9SS type A sorting domain-containing protein [bacterium]|nr:T9SS type A sorting domain-containing protein [bacterium]
MLRRNAVSVLIASSLLVAAASPLRAGPHVTGRNVTPLSWLEEMEAYFDANPELKTTPGSGWNVYNRAKWFITPRLENGRLPAADARWRIWERKTALETQTRAVNTWFSLGPENFAGRILSMDFDPVDPSIVYVGACDGGVWRSTDSGVSWTPISDEIPVLAVGGIAVSKVDRDVIVIGTGMGAGSAVRVGGVGILRSTDGGATWIATDFSVPPGGWGGGLGFHFVEASPSGTFLAGCNDGLYRSSDDGATWVQKRTGSEWYDAAWKPGDADRVYSVRGDAAPGASVKVSTDDGQTWAKAGTGQPPSYQWGKAKIGLSGSTIYCAVAEPGGPGWSDVIRSDDDGNTWVSTSPTGLPSGQSWLNVVCAADPDDTEKVIVGCVGLGRSVNGGATFSNVLGSMHVDQHVARYEPGSPNTVWMGNDGGIYRSTSDGAAGTFLSRNNGLVTYQFYDICVNRGVTSFALGGTQDNGTDRWFGTPTWANAIGADGMVCNVGSDGTTVYGEIQNGSHYKSVNSGSSFFGFNNGLTGTGIWVTPVALNPNDPEHLLTTTSDGIFRSTNGSSWQNVASHGAKWIDISRADGQVAWSIQSGSAHVTTDNGNTWAQVAPFGFPTGSATKILAHPTDPAAALATFSGYTSAAHVAMTTDLGATWTDVTGDLPDVPVHAVAMDPANPSHWYIGTDVGVWTSHNGGAHWTPFETGLPNAVVSDLEIADTRRKLVAGTLGRGMWEVDITALDATDAGEPQVAASPRTVMLDPPAPNPVTDRTFLRFAAKSEEEVAVRIYDVQGRIVSEVAHFERGDGIIRTAPWFPNGVPAGVYFAVVEANGERLSRKVTVLK